MERTEEQNQCEWTRLKATTGPGNEDEAGFETVTRVDREFQKSHFCSEEIVDSTFLDRTLSKYRLNGILDFFAARKETEPGPEFLFPTTKMMASLPEISQLHGKSKRRLTKENLKTR